MIKFKELSKKDKIFRIVNLSIMLVAFLTCVGLAIYYQVIGDPDRRLFVTLGISVVMILPYLGEMIFRKRLSNILFLAYQIYAIFAGVFGAALNIYNLVWWFDIFVHIIAGYVFSLIGIFVLSTLQDYKKLNPITVMIFCLSITLAIELVWELAEWGVANIAHLPVQGEFVEGYAPLVTDTMEDILCNLSGGIVFVIHFLVGKYTKFNLGINVIENQLTTSINKKYKKIREENAKNNQEIKLENTEEKQKLEEK